MPAHWKPVSPAAGELAEFAERLRDAVSGRGYSIRQIASGQRMSRSTVYAVLAGERLPSHRQLEDLLMVHSTSRRPLPAADVNWLFATRSRLEKTRRSRAKPPMPPVQLGPVAEQQRFTQALNDWVGTYRPHFPFWWPQLMGGGGVSRGWLQRFLDGKAIPSESGMRSLLPEDHPPAMDRRFWDKCVEAHYQLQWMAMEARQSRRTAREVLRMLQGRR
ncbi:helix-turn-helix domain-containing protein [Streptomyces sp. NPDC029216]|uniref:helix-turn-helix domain-containing protein n=1 Tax=Streptomyces sp. NPDC029216 TaxID=3154701 RepID=UPI0033CF6DFF